MCDLIRNSVGRRDASPGGQKLAQAGTIKAAVDFKKLNVPE